MTFGLCLQLLSNSSEQVTGSLQCDIVRHDQLARDCPTQQILEDLMHVPGLEIVFFAQKADHDDVV